MNSMIVVAMIVVYSNVVVAVFASDASIHCQRLRDILAVLAWPVMVPFVLAGVVYFSIFKAPKRIRVDLHNRKLLNEFEEFIANKGKKDD